MMLIYIPLHTKAKEIMKAHFVQPDLRWFKEDHYTFQWHHPTLTPVGFDEERLFIDQDYKILTLREKGLRR